MKHSKKHYTMNTTSVTKKQSNNYIGKIRMKPHLLRFVETLENIEREEPLNLRGSSPITQLIKSHLNFKKFLSYPATRKIEEYSEHLHIIIPSRNSERGNFYITESSEMYINDFLDSYFNQMLAIRVAFFESLGFRQNIIIQSTLEYLDISEDDAAFDRIKKAVYRVKTKEKNEKTFDIFVPNFDTKLSYRERKKVEHLV